MRKAIYSTLIFLFLTNISFSQKSNLNYYLPDITYDKSVPAPAEILGHEVGEWHVSHDKLYWYMKTLAETSERVSLQQYARSHEQRPLVVLTISSKDNMKNIETIRKEHLALSDMDGDKTDISKMPTVVYQGYSIHGNESSGSNAAVLMAYYLAAGQDEEVDKILDNTIILLDPCMNPDGLDRFASWVNRHKSINLVSDVASRELNEVWPGGRTNHYWFDLNRDWLLVQHPESQGRIKIFHEWKPNILTDHHEMGHNSTYFFQPGIASRVNPMTPARNQEITEDIAKFHAAALDKLGSFYYSGESFDDFYYGKGSTYPDANGCIGILFEQASSRGHLHDSSNGPLSFPFTIRNQVATSFSTLAAGVALREELLSFQQDFNRSISAQAARDKSFGYVFNAGEDHSRLLHFLELLDRHKIAVHKLSQDVQVNGKQFEAANSLVLPLNQNQYRLLKGSFEKITTFQDSLFYDVSAWTLPLAFNLNYSTLNKAQSALAGKKIDFQNFYNNIISNTKIIGKKSDYAYVFRWDDYYAPKVLNKIQSEGLRTKVSTTSFGFMINGKKEIFQPGSILLPIQNQNKTSAEIHALLEEAIQGTGTIVYAIDSGLASDGVDLGSPSLLALKKPKVALIVGESTRSYNAGEVWHLLDTRYGMQVSLIEAEDINKVDLQQYNCIVMSGGSYGKLSSANKIKTWLNNGGTLITMLNAIKWAKSNGLAKVTFVEKEKKNSKADVKRRRAYKKLHKDSGAQVIGGAIGACKLDLTHPLCYGYANDELPVFRRGDLFLKPANNVYSMPVVYTDKPLLSGYISKQNQQLLKESASVIVCGYGSGKVICMADNPNFRAFWYGTNKLFANALFFGSIISSGATEK